MNKIKPLFYILFCFIVYNGVSAQQTDTIVKKETRFQLLTYSPISPPTIDYSELF